jgi:hypothetical protein
VERCLYAAGLLRAHGLLSDGEREKVHARMLRRYGATTATDAGDAQEPRNE